MAKHLNVKCLYHTIIITLSCASPCCSGICHCGLLRSQKGGVRPFRGSLFESRGGLPKPNKTWTCNSNNGPSNPGETQFFQIRYCYVRDICSLLLGTTEKNHQTHLKTLYIHSVNNSLAKSLVVTAYFKGNSLPYFNNLMLHIKASSFLPMKSAS